MLLSTVLGAHVVEGSGDGGLAAVEDKVRRRVPRMRLAICDSTV